MGAERADEIMERLGATLAEMPFEFLRRADARQLLSFLADEHPQTIALVLAHMAPPQSAIVLSGLEPEPAGRRRPPDRAHGPGRRPT